MPIIGAIVAGGLAWAALALAEAESASLAENLPAALLSVGIALGGRFEGDFVNLSSYGFWVVPLALPVASGLLVSRLHRRSDLLSYVVGLVATSTAHAVALSALAMIEIYDPTSFATARVSWVPLASVGVAAVTWATVWAVRERDLGRPVSVGLAASGVLGAGAGVALAAIDGVRATLLPLAALAGGALGPNAVGLTTVWAAGAEAGELGGRSADVSTFTAFSSEVGGWLWLLPVAACGFLGMAAWRARIIEDLPECGRRLRDTLLATVAVTVCIAVFAGARLQPSQSATRQVWIGIADGPGAFVQPVLVIVLVLLVPQVIRAVRAGETWPGDAIRAGATWLRRPARADHSWTPSPPVYAPGQTPHPWQPFPHGQPGAMGTTPTASPPPPPAPHTTVTTPVAAPMTNPFDDAAAPPVSAAWERVPPAPLDPGARAAADRPRAPLSAAPPPPTVRQESWRHAPPPAVPTDSGADAPGPGVEDQP